MRRDLREWGEWAHFDVNIRDVAYNIVLVVNDGEGCNAFVVHKF